MDKIVEYLSQPGARDKVINALGLFSVIGGVLVSIVLFIAALAH
jgi:hypothetical protein